MNHGPPPDAEGVLELLRQRGHRMTAQRRALVVEIMNTSGHIAPAEVAERVQQRVPGVNPSTVYRTLELLEEVGVLTHAHVERGSEYHHAHRHDHVHLICSSCGVERSLPIATLGEVGEDFERATGFRPDFTHYAVWGLCEDCKNQRRNDGSKP
ncbi:MAG: Fur family transcriptional regulator [Actinomycetota bacterium]